MEELPSTPGNKREPLFRTNLNNGSLSGISLNKDKQAQTEEPGAVYNRLSGYTGFIATRGQEIQVHNKTVRSLGVKLGDPEGLEALGVIDCYFALHKKERQTRDKIIDWSGALWAWKRRMNKGIDAAINRGYLEQVNKLILITEKGKKVLIDYDNTFEEVKTMYEDKAAELRSRGTEHQQQKRRIARRAAEHARQMEEGTYVQAEPKNYSH